MDKSVFKTLSEINCNEWADEKNGLKYMPWAWAWSKVKEHYPLAYYTIYEADGGRPYFTDGRTCWVKTGVTIEGLEHVEYLPVMDYRNQSISADKITSMDMNKAIQRSLTKACARHGLGLYIYAGEDVPEAVYDKIDEAVNTDQLVAMVKELEQSNGGVASDKVKAAARKKYNELKQVNG